MVGGAEKYLRTLLPGLLARRHEIGLVYEYAHPMDGEQIDSDTRDLPIWCLEDIGSRAVLKNVAEWQPDLVYSQGLANLQFEKKLLELYSVTLYSHSYNGSCISGLKCHSFPEPQPCSRTLGAACLGLYYPRRCGGLSPTTMWRMFRIQMDRKASLPQYQAVLVASRHMQEEFLRNGVSADKLHLVPLPTTDLAPDECEPASKDPGGEILFLGRLSPVKGLHYLIQSIPAAAEQLNRPLKLTIAGDGPEKAKLQQLALRLRVQATFVGWVDKSKKIELLRAADVLAVPSLWPEPFGLVGIEAGCVGLPAVGYAVGGIGDWLLPGESGELAPGNPPTVVGIAEALVRALANRTHYLDLRRASWRMAKRFTLKDHLDKLESLAFSTQSAARAPVKNSSDRSGG
jgi:glycosyltransferase involved in cell wall biosynthesis